MEQILEIYQKLDTIIKSHGKDPITIYGVTNYVDMRIIYTIKALSETLTGEEKADIQNCVKKFLEILTKKGDQYLYYIDHSGTYELKVPYDILHYISENNF